MRRHRSGWRQRTAMRNGGPRAAILNVSLHAGKFSSDRTIQEYVDDIWHLDKIKVEL